MKKPARRVRRSPEEAQRLILETAQALIARTGPEGLRLQDIAAEAGIPPADPAPFHRAAPGWCAR